MIKRLGSYPNAWEKLCRFVTLKPSSARANDPVLCQVFIRDRLLRTLDSS